MIDQWSTCVHRILAPNPGPMTLDGTNTLIVRSADSQSAIVVDPGPLDDGHFERILATGPIDLIVLTHHHLDHTEAAIPLHEATGAPIQAFDAALVRDAEPLVDGELIAAAGLTLRVVSTPGHTSDSVCLVIPDDVVAGSDAFGTIITGDTILGRGTTVIADTGSIADYLATLKRLQGLGDLAIFPAHGDPRGSLGAACAELLQHRLGRLTEIQAALDALGLQAQADDATVAAVTDAIYPDVPASIRYAAELSTRAQLDYLAVRR